MIPMAAKKAQALPIKSAVLQAKRWNQWFTTSGRLPLVGFEPWTFSCFIAEPVRHKGDPSLCHGERLPHPGDSKPLGPWSTKPLNRLALDGAPAVNASR